MTSFTHRPPINHIPIPTIAANTTFQTTPCHRLTLAAERASVLAFSRDVNKSRPPWEASEMWTQCWRIDR